MHSQLEARDILDIVIDSFSGRFFNPTSKLPELQKYHARVCWFHLLELRDNYAAPNVQLLATLLLLDRAPGRYCDGNLLNKVPMLGLPSQHSASARRVRVAD